MAQKQYTVKEVAAVLGVHPNTIKNMIHDGRMRAFKTKGHAGHYRISQEALEEYLVGEGQQIFAPVEAADLPPTDRPPLGTVTERGLHFLQHVGSQSRVFGSYLETLTPEERSQQLKGKAHIWVLETIRQAERRFPESLLTHDFDVFADYLATFHIGVAGKERMDGGLTLTCVLLYPTATGTVILDGTLQQFHPYLGGGLVTLNWQEQEQYYHGLTAVTYSAFQGAINDRNGHFFKSFLREADRKRRRT